MSVAFVPKRLRGKAKINQETVQRLLDENDQLIRCITDYMQKGRAVECVQYQQILHRNIVYLATIADASPDIVSSSANSTSEAAPALTTAVTAAEEQGDGGYPLSLDVSLSVGGPIQN